MIRKIKTVEERFNKHWIPVTESGCWLWTAGINDKGYGNFFLKKGKTVKAHRVSYKLFNGKIPEGMCVCHHCDNPLCVNPNHLFLGTLKDNTWDMIKKDRSTLVSGRYVVKNGVTHCKRGHPLTGDNVMIGPTSGKRKCKKCDIARQKLYLERKKENQLQEKVNDI